MTVLDRHLYALPERNRILDMVTVETYPTRPVGVAAHNYSVVRFPYLLLRTPCCVEIILASRSVKTRRPLLAVDKNHVVALTPPVPLGCMPKVSHVQVATCVVPASLHIENDIVPVTRWILRHEKPLFAGCRFHFLAG